MTSAGRHDPWTKLALDVQRDTGHYFSRLSVATLIAEIRRDLRNSGTEDPSVELVGDLAVQELQSRMAREAELERAARQARTLRSW